jgi:hypothetical protein
MIDAISSNLELSYYFAKGVKFDLAKIPKEIIDSIMKVQAKLEKFNPEFYNKIIQQNQLQPVEASRIRIKKISFKNEE